MTITLKEMMTNFPHSIFDTKLNQLRLQSKDAKKWDKNPICMNLKCRNDDIYYIGKNSGYGVYVYECGKCKTISLQGFEFCEELGAGNVGDIEDVESVD